MEIERDAQICIDGSLVTRFVRICSTLQEAQTSLPDLTEEQYQAIRCGKACFSGTSVSGLSYRAERQD